MRRIFILLALSLLPLVNLLTPGLPAGHDTRDHVARIANFYQNLAEGEAIPRWAGNLNWGYGHPVMMFLYPAPSYAASAFHAVGFSFVDSVKLVFAVAFVASLLTMYAWATLQWGAAVGLIAAVLYGFAPYRFVDLYVRGAIGEHVAFVPPPLILWGFLKLARTDKKPLVWMIVVAAGMAGLVLSHNALSLMFLPVILLYGLYLFIFEAQKSLRFAAFAGFSLLLGFGLSSFFWLPALIEGKYTLRDIVTAGEFTNRFVSVRDLIYSSWSYGGAQEIAKHLGVAQLLGVVAAVWTLLRTKGKKKERVLGWGLVVVLLGVSFLMTRPSLFVWENVSLLQKFQFPWRLLSVSVFAAAALAAWFGKRGIVLCLLAVALTVPMWRAQSFVIRSESFYTGIYEGTTDTGESSPIWSVRFMEHTYASPVEVIEGEAEVTLGPRTNTKHAYTIAAATDSRIRENTLYFPGWEVRVDGSPVVVEFQDPNNRGLMTYRVSPGTHEVEVMFGNTKLRSFADAVTAVSLGLLVALGTMAVWKKRI